MFHNESLFDGLIMTDQTYMMKSPNAVTINSNTGNFSSAEPAGCNEREKLPSISLIRRSCFAFILPIRGRNSRGCRKVKDLMLLQSAKSAGRKLRQISKIRRSAQCDRPGLPVLGQKKPQDTFSFMEGFEVFPMNVRI